MKSQNIDKLTSLLKTEVDLGKSGETGELIHYVVSQLTWATKMKSADKVIRSLRLQIDVLRSVHKLQVSNEQWEAAKDKMFFALKIGAALLI